MADISDDHSLRGSGSRPLSFGELYRAKFRRNIRLATYCGIAVWLILVFFYLYRFGGDWSDDQQNWGQFGDYLGGVLNPAFGFAGFLILLNTLYEQRFQIEEERAVRRIENFESTFFELLHRFSEVVDDIRFEYVSEPLSSGHGLRLSYEETKLSKVKGRDAFRCMFKYGYRPLFAKGHAQEDQLDEKFHAAWNKKFYVQWQHELGIYFRTLYHIFKFVDISELSNDQKARYGSIARAQLSAYELSAVFYNGLWGEGRRGFRPLIQKYGLLKHIKKQHVLRASDLSQGALYEESAFVTYKRRLEIWRGVVPEIDYD